jgi:iron complex outermembrane recepter protein
VKTGPLTMVSGLYYFKIRTDFRFLSILNPLTQPAPIGGATPPTGTFSRLDGIYANHNWAAFSQATFDVTDQLQVTGGIRYTEETKDFRPDQYLVGFPNQPFVPRQWNRLRSHATTGTVSAQYRWSDSIMTYASWTRGYKAGGWNRSYTALVPGATFFRPEFATSYEGGAKFDINRVVRFNLAAFRTDYKDIQLLYRVGVVPTVVNAGEAVIKGLEGELTLAPSRNLLITGNLSHLVNSIGKVATVPGASTAVTTASSLPYMPKWQGQLAAQYTFDISSHHQLSFRLNGNYTGSQFFEIGNSPVVSQHMNVTTVDAIVTLEDTANGWDARLAVRNIGDKIYPISGNAAFTTPGGYDEIAYNRGREWALTVSKKF